LHDGLAHAQQARDAIDSGRQIGCGVYQVIYCREQRTRYYLCGGGDRRDKQRRERDGKRLHPFQRWFDLAASPNLSRSRR
jgi:hypothetical protein